MAKVFGDSLSVRPMGIMGTAPQKVTVSAGGSGTIANSSNSWVFCRLQQSLSGFSSREVDCTGEFTVCT